MHLFDLGLHFITFIRITWIFSLNNSKHTKNNRFLSSEVSYFNGIYGLYDNYVCETAPISIDTWWCVFTFTWLDRHNTTQLYGCGGVELFEVFFLYKNSPFIR